VKCPVADHRIEQFGSCESRRGVDRRENQETKEPPMIGKTKERRVLYHPVLGKQDPKKRKLKIIVDGKVIEALEGETITAALLANGIRVYRKSIRYGEPRGLFCGIGQCASCVMTVNGIPNVRTCVTPVKEGMTVKTQSGRGRLEKW